MNFKNKIFNISSNSDFEKLALEIFNFQYKNNSIYQKYVELVKGGYSNITGINEIPFLPISFFKTHKIVSLEQQKYTIFESSGTTGKNTSKHYVSDRKLYEKSFSKCFELFFGNIADYDLLALLPSYSEKENSSLIYMIDKLKQKTKSKIGGYYLYNHKDLYEKLSENEKNKQKTILFGVSFALLDFFDDYKIELQNTQIIETGGMKGRKKEIIRKDLHNQIKTASGLSQIMSEYGMTELLSQAYSKKDDVFETPPWLKILIRDPNDPFSMLPPGRTGGVNIIDLANVNSCSFVETQDLGKLHKNNKFEVLGRFDTSQIRGCNTMYN